MTFDSSRFTFDAWRDFLGVVMQQGRVQLDSDWNELVSQFLRRMQVGTLDTMGPAIVPRETPEGFQITLTGGKLKIGVGRMYVDGILAENHGGGEKNWYAGLAELQGKEPIDYDAQPYYPDPPELPQAGSSYVVYLDVWQREVTHLQYPELIEKAVGVDTTGRLQTVWQVKLLQLAVAGGLTCSSVASTKEWSALTRPSGARLTTSTSNVPDVIDPCQIPPSGGYKGLENQLYCVEIHEGDRVAGWMNRGGANFKWSRDNATVATRVSRINPGRQSIVVERMGRDEVLRFSNGDWIEITDDVRELGDYPGVMCQVKLLGGVDDATSTITLTKPLPDGTFPSTEDGNLDSSRNTRVRRWDQKGRILREDGTVYFDLDSPDGDEFPDVIPGVIPVPNQDTTLLLENGILVRFSLASEGDFHTGDYWNFAARTADASIEILADAPPRGIHHHYARLAVVNTPADGAASPIASDCRVPWPAETGTGHDCSCDRCITPEGHNNGTATIQQAIDALEKTGGVICLAGGFYTLNQSLVIRNANSLRIRGKGWMNTTLVADSHEIGSILQLEGGRQIVIENLAIQGPAIAGAATPGKIDLIKVTTTAYLDLNHLFLHGRLDPLNEDSGLETTGVSLAGTVIGFSMSECIVVGRVGIEGRLKNLSVSALKVTHNAFFCSLNGIGLWNVLYDGETHITHNVIRGTSRTAIGILGDALPGSNCLIDGNVLYPLSDGILAAIDGLHIARNKIAPLEGMPQWGTGVMIDGLRQRDINCWIIENHITGMYSGIGVRMPLGSAMIKQNLIERSGEGIVFTRNGSARRLSIENNHFVDIRGPVAIQVVVLAKQAVPEHEAVTQHADIAGNVVKGLAMESTGESSIAGILVLGGGHIRICRNHLADIGPVTSPADSYVAGIEVIKPFESANIAENTIIRNEEREYMGICRWYAILIRATGERVYKNLLTVVAEDQTVISTETVTYILPLNSANSAVTKLTGNHIVAHTNAPIVDVAGPFNISFTGNDCRGSSYVGDWHPAESGTGMIALKGDITIASGNTATVIRNAPTGTADSISSISISSTKTSYSVIGNVTNRPILISGEELAAPWKQLNILNTDTQS